MLEKQKMKNEKLIKQNTKLQKKIKYLKSTIEYNNLNNRNSYDK